MECKVKENRKQCKCNDKDCTRNGRCCECVAYHRALGQMPQCFRKG